MLRLDFNLVLTMINLVVLFLILRKFLFNPVMDIMEKRKAMIADGIKNANDQQEKAAKLREQYEDALSEAKDESLEMIEQAKKDARVEYDRIVNEADAQAGKMLKTARQTIELEREQTLREMKSQVAGLAMDTVRKIMIEQSDTSDSQTAYDQFLKEAGDSHDGKAED